MSVRVRMYKRMRNMETGNSCPCLFVAEACSPEQATGLVRGTGA
jgi:hypothetical protein